MARVCHRVCCTHGHGVPLAAEVSEKAFKVVLLDTGLFMASLANEGAGAEQLVGQMIRALGPSFVEPALYYWQRERKGAEAGVPYYLVGEMPRLLAALG
jgi:hypothetical protein